MLYKNVGTSFFRFVTNHAFDKPTDGRTDSILVASTRCHSMQRGKIVQENLKIVKNVKET